MNVKLKTRWSSDPGRSLVQRLERFGRGGNGYEVLESPFGTVTETGRIDLRGLMLPERTELRRVTFRFADLTGAVLKKPWLELSVFTDVCFDKSSLQMLVASGGAFENCSFRKTNFRRAHLGFLGSRFTKCYFEKADFIQCGFIRPEFDDCCFDDCTFSGVDFRGASFEKCEFRGEVRGVWFRGGFPLPSFTKDWGVPRPNKMNCVSFKKAALFDVTFSDGCDLSSVIPPDDGRHALFDRWPERIKSVFEQSRAWPEPGRRQGEIFFLAHEATPYKDGTYPKTQDWYLIGVDDLMNQHGREPGTKIWEALQSTKIEEAAQKRKAV